MGSMAICGYAGTTWVVVRVHTSLTNAENGATFRDFPAHRHALTLTKSASLIWLRAMQAVADTRPKLLGYITGSSAKGLAMNPSEC